MRIIGYCRTSTDRQEISLQDQERKLEQYAALHEHQLVDVILEHESAGSLKRDGLQRALVALKENKAEALLVLKLDRLCRSLRDLMGLLDLFEKHEKTLLSVQESLDTKSPGGRLVLSVLGAVAEWELASIRARTKAALGFKRDSDELIGSVPYGWKLAPGHEQPIVGENGKKLPRPLVIDEQEQAGLVFMRQLRANGESLTSHCGGDGRSWLRDEERQAVVALDCRPSLETLGLGRRRTAYDGEHDKDYHNEQQNGTHSQSSRRRSACSYSRPAPRSFDGFAEQRRRVAVVLRRVERIAAAVLVDAAI